MTRLETGTAYVGPPPVSEVMWRTYDEGGWQALRDHDLERAERYFEKADDFLATAPADDPRRGRTLAGMAWVEYRCAQQIDHGGPVDPEIIFTKAHEKAKTATAILGAAELSQSEREYLARAHHIEALTSIEFCYGAPAVDALTKAAAIYRELLLIDEYLDCLHLLAKLMQCRRKFDEAARLFQRIADEALDPQRGFKALVDLANALAWSGYVREAWQLRTRWRRLEAEVKSQTAEDDWPREDMMRGMLVFARIHLLYGDFGQAQQLLQDARCAMQQLAVSPCICCTVFYVLSAELALARGDLSEAEGCLDKLKGRVHEIELSASGYGCLEVVAIDAACQICVIETVCREVYRRVCCCVRRCFRVKFVPRIVKETVTERKIRREPIDYAAVLAEIANGIRAGIEFHKGRWTASQVLLAGSVSGIQTRLHTQSPLLIPLRLLQAEVDQARKVSPTEVRQHLRQAREIVLATRSSPRFYEAEQYRLLGNWRLQLGDDDLAEILYTQSLKHSLGCRSENHPTHRLTELLGLWAGGLAALPEGREKISRSLDRMCEISNGLGEVVHCYDYRIGISKTLPPWLCFLSGGISSAQRGLSRAEHFWGDRDLHWAIADTRWADARLGSILSSVAGGAGEDEDLGFDRYVKLATREISVPMVAFELNRVGMLVRRAGFMNAAKFCFEKSIQLYQSQDFGGFKPTALEILNSIDEPGKNHESAGP